MEIDLKNINDKIKQKIEQHYSNKFVYAIPDWTMISALPDIFITLTIHGKNGINLIKQKLDFEVDFNSKESLEYYVNFLQHKMDIQEKIIGYIFFYKMNAIAVKDVNYTLHLTDFQEKELQKFNQNQVEDYGMLITDCDLNVLDSTNELNEF